MWQSRPTLLLSFLCFFGFSLPAVALEIEQPLPPGVAELQVRYQVRPSYSEVWGTAGSSISLKRLVLGPNYNPAFSGSIQRNESQLRFDFLLGWTPNWTLGATVPWEQKEQSISLALVNPSAASSELQRVAANVQSENLSGLGDVSLWMRYELSNSYRWYWTLTPQLVLPTGSTGTARGLDGLSIGDEQIDVGLKLQAQWYPAQSEGWRQHTSLEGINQIAGERETLTGEKVRYLPGNLLDLRYGWTYEQQNFMLGTEFQLNYQTRSKLGGETGIVRRLYQWNLELGYGNLNLLEQQALPLPFQVRVGWMRPFQGENQSKQAQYYLSGDFFF